MITTTEIWHEGRMQMALVEYDVRYGKPNIIRVKIGLQDVTGKINSKAIKTIKKAMTADMFRRVSA